MPPCATLLLALFGGRLGPLEPAVEDEGRRPWNGLGQDKEDSIHRSTRPVVVTLGEKLISSGRTVRTVVKCSALFVKKHLRRSPVH